MARKKVKDIVADLLRDILEAEGVVLFNVEFVKEGREHYLRVFLDKLPDENGEEQFLDIETCERVSRALSDKLDEADPISENYTLEVSSPGMDRPLIHDEDFTRFSGRLVEIKFYKPFNGTKELTAELKGLSPDGENVIIKDENEESVDIPRSQISKINLAVVF